MRSALIVSGPSSARIEDPWLKIAVDLNMGKVCLGAYFKGAGRILSCKPAALPTEIVMALNSRMLFLCSLSV